jgi:hypothetical protein
MRSAAMSLEAPAIMVWGRAASRLSRFLKSLNIRQLRDLIDAVFNRYLRRVEDDRIERGIPPIATEQR